MYLNKNILCCNLIYTDYIKRCFVTISYVYDISSKVESSSKFSVIKFP